MTSKSTGPEPYNNKLLKVVAAFSLLIGAVYIAVGGYQKTQPSAAINNGNTGDGFPGPNREQMQQQIAREVGITPAQQAEMDKARAAAREEGNWRGMREAMERILTEEQREKMRTIMQSRMAERDRRAKAMLSEADYEALRERRSQWGRGGRGGGPGGPGGRGGDRPAN
jgi:Spy/CpxP family protein refolding chaperone